ncbi:MAG: hypothetical protein U0271_46375 [Polyangiaceae bacterium]
MGQFDARRTQVAQSAYDFSRYFSQTFNGVKVLGNVPRRPELIAPEGMSTAGGKQARQPICLQPEAQTPTGAQVITVGWVEIPTRRAVMRTYRCLLGMHNARFRGRPFDLDARSYDAFFDQAKSLFAQCGLAVTEEDEPAPSSVPPSALGPAREAPVAQPSGGQSSFWLAAAVGFVAFVVGAFAGGLAVYARFVGFK